MNPKLSIIIPCYNSECTLDKTLESVVAQSYNNWEAIIVNDGSTDDTENIALSWIEKDERFTYFHKSNEGLGKTRNFGIEKAKGQYILPLDSDNLVDKDFAKNAIEILDTNGEIGIVHGHAEYFGKRTGLWEIELFDLEKILIQNYIDACAIYRESLWSAVGGYDENMPYQGLEDWEFWIALGSKNIKFHHTNTITFKYFVNDKSMINSFTDLMVDASRDYVSKKYHKLYYKYYSENRQVLQKILQEHKIKLSSEKFVLDLFLKTFFGFTLFGKYKKQ
jgi:glycosyltransferase involved in cell wall biosynthesis